MSARRFHVTYDLVTPESAEQSDSADNGFVTSDDSRVSVADLWGAKAGEIKAECAMTLREAIQVFGEHYGRHGLESDYPTLYQAEGAQDWRTGAVERLAFHVPDSASAASWERVRRLLEGGAT